MKSQREKNWSRREFLKGVSLAGSAAFIGLRSEAIAAEPPLETTRIRIPQIPSTGAGPKWVPKDCQKAEGLPTSQYTPWQGTQGARPGLASGEAIIGGHFPASLILRLEAEDPIVMLEASTSAASSYWAPI